MEKYCERNREIGTKDKNRPFLRGGGGGLRQVLDGSVDDLGDEADTEDGEGNSAGETGKRDAAAREDSVVGLPELVELLGGIVVIGVAAGEEDIGEVEIGCDDDVGEEGDENASTENFHTRNKKLVHKITPN